MNILLTLFFIAVLALACFGDCIFGRAGIAEIPVPLDWHRVICFACLSTVMAWALWSVGRKETR